jgi:hypothetical protein
MALILRQSKLHVKLCIRASLLISFVLAAPCTPPPALAQDRTLKKIASVKLDATVSKLPVVTADSLSFEGVAVRHPLIRIRADDNERAFSREHTDRGQFDPLTRVELERADVVVGMNILASLHVYVSYDERTLYISAANAH